MTLEKLHLMVRKHHLSLVPFGVAWRVYGHGLDIIFSAPSDLIESDFEPANKTE